MEENKDDIIEVEKVEETKQEENEELKTEAPKEEPKVEVIKEEAEKDKKGFSIAALVLGIIAIVLCCVWYISIPCGILAIIFGIVGIKSSKKGMSIAGLITGTVGLVISIIIFIALVFLGMVIGLSDGLDGLDNDGHYYDDFDFYSYNRSLFD